MTEFHLIRTDDTGQHPPPKNTELREVNHPKPISMKLLVCSLVCLLLNTVRAQDAPMMFASIPCRVPADSVPFVYDENNQALTGYPVRIATMKKTATRRSFNNLTERERNRLRKQARRAHACEIVVIDRYQRPPGSKLKNPEMEARMEQEIQFYMVQRRRPCPECPTANK